MKKSKLLPILAVLLITAGGAIYGFTYQSDFPTTGTVEYSAYQNCPKKGTADCPYIKNCPKKGTKDCPYIKGKASCCRKKK